MIYFYVKFSNHMHISQPENYSISLFAFFFSESIDTVLIIQFVFSPCDLKTTVHDEFK